MVEAGNEDEISSIANRIRDSLQIRRVDVFIKPNESEVKPSAPRPKLKGIDLFDEASVALGGRKSVLTVEGYSLETQQLTDEVRTLDISGVIRTLRSNEVNRALDNLDSRQRLTSSLHDFFIGLSNSFDNSPMAQEALQELAKEFQAIADEDPESYRKDLNSITGQLERIDEMRKVYLQNARDKGFDKDFVTQISGRRNQ